MASRLGRWRVGWVDQCNVEAFLMSNPEKGKESLPLRLRLRLRVRVRVRVRVRMRLDEESWVRRIEEEMGM